MKRVVFLMTGLLAALVSALGTVGAATPLGSEVSVVTVGDKVVVQAVVRDLTTETVLFAPQVVTRKGGAARAESTEAGSAGDLRGLVMVEFDAGEIQVTVEIFQGESPVYRSRFSAPVP